MIRNCLRKDLDLISENMPLVIELLTTGIHYQHVALIVILLTHLRSISRLI